MSSNTFIEITESKTDANILIKVDDVIQIKPKFDDPIYMEDVKTWISNEIGTTIIMRNITIESSDEYTNIARTLKDHIVR
jgi:hypothetical protein